MQIKKMLASALTAGMMLTFIPATSMADSTGWKGNYDDGWRYYTSGTEYVKNDWKKIDGEWYFFDASGYMQTGWLKSGSTWYYLESDGAMISDTWEMIDGKLYCFNKSGAMESNKWIAYDEVSLSYLDFDTVGSALEVAQNLQKEYEGKKMWRYVGSDGAAYVGWRTVGGQWYYFDSEIDTVNNYVDMYTNLYLYDNEDRYGAMRYGWLLEDDDSFYFFDGNGEYLNDGWFNYEGSNSWLYFQSDGRAVKGWKKIDGYWYYFYPYNAVILYGTSFPIDDNRYYFKSNGQMLESGWYKDSSGDWYLAKSNGALYSYEWYQENGKWYYFNYSGKMICDRTNYPIGGKYYDFDSHGVCTNPYSGRTKTT